MSADESNRVPDPDQPEEPVPDVTPAGPDTPSVPDVPPGPDVPDVPPIDPEPAPEPGPTGVVPPGGEGLAGYTADGVPTFESVRERIEHRTATAIGAEELAHATTTGRTLDEQYEERRVAAAERLDDIRRSLAAE